MDDIMIKVAKIEEHLKSQDEKVSDIKNMLTNFIDCADKKYASKWTEKAILWVGLAIGGGVLGILGSIILGHLDIKI